MVASAVSDAVLSSPTAMVASPVIESSSLVPLMESQMSGFESPIVVFQTRSTVVE